MEYDVIIVGGGAVGLATALQLQKQNPKFKLVVIEKDNVVANHQTGNNSNVIHSGVYYKPGSLKAKNCIGGYDMLLDFIRKHEIPHNLCGKVIVATEEKELPLLKTILERGNQNGLKNLKMLTGDQVREHEPHVAGIAGIHVPQTGIVDYRVVAEKYAEVFQKQGGTLKLGEKVVDIQLGSGNAVVVTQKSTYSGKLVVNCGGLYADKLAKLTRNDVNFK
ncbi:MAG: FAD-dependent oxidoreductase, partial [Chryseolinea sp.]